MGKYIELYDKDAELIHELAGVRLKKGFRAMKTSVGFPMSLKSVYIQKALADGHPVAVLEEGKPGKWVRHRFVAALYYSLSAN